MVNALLTRQLLKSPANSINRIDAKVLYPLLTCKSSHIPHAAFHLLHRKIPAEQEQVSLEAVLAKTDDSRLPEELISLILEPPTLERTEHTYSSTGLPVDFGRSYLLGWKLVFDHWSNASYTVQSNYVRNIKEGDCLSQLLDLIFEILIGSRPKPCDASKYEIESYMPDFEDSPEKDLHWLLIHLYYLSLKHLPALSKAWWRDHCTRQLQKPVEAWTQKYVCGSSTIFQWVCRSLC